MIAANLAMRASGARLIDDVPSDQGRLNSTLTPPSSRIFRRSLAERGWVKSPFLAGTSMESPVHNERCTPGSEGGARKPAG
jgi:hypothetical protein